MREGGADKYPSKKEAKKKTWDETNRSNPKLARSIPQESTLNSKQAQMSKVKK
jgi:hypothetical protein